MNEMIRRAAKSAYQEEFKPQKTFVEESISE